MTAEVPSPHTTLIILLGASEWPNSPQFQSSEAFANTARRLAEYFLKPDQFKLPRENLLDLFNSSKTWDEIDEEIGTFLDQSISAMRDSGNAARDVLIYFIGHGGFADQSHDYHLALRRTRHTSLRASAIPMKSLVETIKRKAQHLRRFMILDCCFAGSAFYTFQGDPSQGAIRQTADAFRVNTKRKAQGVPKEGTTLLCSSDQQSASLLMPDGSSTMFSKALLDALSKGDTDRQDYLSFRDLNELTADLLDEMSRALEAGTPKPPRPALDSPDQHWGDIADIPFFPNLQTEAERARLAEEEQARKAEAERARLAEVERMKKVEEQARLAKEEQARKAEAERARLAEEEKERARKAEEERVKKAQQKERTAREALKQERPRQAEKKQQSPNSVAGPTTDPLTARKSKDQWFNEGRTYHQAQQYQKAIDAYSRAIALDPSYVWAYYNRGNAYSDLKQYKEAVADYDRALALDPSLDLAKTKRAGVRHLLTRY